MIALRELDAREGSGGHPSVHGTHRAPGPGIDRADEPTLWPGSQVATMGPWTCKPDRGAHVASNPGLFAAPAGGNGGVALVVAFRAAHDEGSSI
jgi:hypothetical protein